MLKVWVEAKDELRSILKSRDYDILKLCNHDITPNYILFIFLLK